jgi:uncharacterized protein (TIGR04255 family)
MTWSPETVSEALGYPLGRHYEHAPINEAAFDIRVQLPVSVTVDQLREVGQGEEDYPTDEPLFAIANRLSFNPQQFSSDVQQIAKGFRWTSTDGLHVLQASLDGFTFSRLRPYRDWAAFSAEAFRLWDRYKAIASPTTISRLALRYVNQIDVPSTLRLDLDAYLRTRLELSELLPQTLDGFFSTIQMALQDAGPRLNLIQTAVTPSPNEIGLVLDIDVFWEDALDASDAEIENVLRQRFGLLRDSKNAVFEACITAQTRELFK